MIATYDVQCSSCPKLLSAFVSSLDCDNPLRFQVAVPWKPMSAFVGSAQRHTAVLRHCYLNNANVIHTWQQQECHAHLCLFTLTLHMRVRDVTPYCSLLLIYQPQKDDRLSQPGWPRNQRNETYLACQPIFQIEQRHWFTSGPN